MSDREFRTRESYDAERITRDMLPDYIRRRGFRDVRDVRRSYGGTESQTIHATTPDGKPLAMRVRLCWRRTSKKWQPDTYSAVQLLQSITNDDWDGSLSAKVEREKSDGTTHFLFVQRDNDDIVYAALVPLSELMAI